jgi:hypothetical protein
MASGEARAFRNYHVSHATPTLSRDHVTFISPGGYLTGHVRGGTNALADGMASPKQALVERCQPSVDFLGR